MTIHLTTTEVAFAVPVGIVGAAIISFLALRWSTNRTLTAQGDTLAKTLEAEERRLQLTLQSQAQMNAATLENQRAIAQDQRLWQEQSALYLDLLKFIDSQCLSLLTRGFPFPEPTEIVELQQYWHKHSAQVTAFAGPNVFALWGAAFKACDEYRNTLHYRKSTSVPDSQVDQRRRNARSAIWDVYTGIRNEMQR